MIRLFGTGKVQCDGLTRRDLLRVGAVGALGLADVFLLREASAARPQPGRFDQAKACFLLFPYGSPPQHESFDPKHDAPTEVRGDIGSLASYIPGVRVGELLPRTAQILDRVTITPA